MQLNSMDFDLLRLSLGNGRSEMKIFLFVMLLGALTAGLARAQFGYNQTCKVGACAYINSKECRDARDAFAEHHNGLYPEQWCNQWYQGQQGRWTPQGNEWQWAGADGDQWFQGQPGHWFQERNGWQFRGDKGDEYQKGRNGWQWSLPGQKRESESRVPHKKQK